MRNSNFGNHRRKGEPLGCIIAAGAKTSRQSVTVLMLKVAPVGIEGEAKECEYESFHIVI